MEKMDSHIELTFNALVPAYCRLIMSPLSAHSSCKVERKPTGKGQSGPDSPNLVTCNSSTALAIAV